MVPMDPITLAFALLFTALTVAIVPVYWIKHGPVNFLWFSDLALFGLLAALWLENPLIASIVAVGVLLPETVWVVSFVSGLVSKGSMSSLAGYMFDSTIPRYLRALSLFHLALPPAMLWMLYRYGYDSRALPAQIVIGGVVLAATYVLAPAEKNINWVRGLGHPPKSRFGPRGHFVASLIGFPLVLYLPTHWLLTLLFERAPQA